MAASEYSANEILGRKISELLYFESTDPVTVARIRAHLDAGRGVRFELLVRGKNGRGFWLDADCQPLHDAHGELCAASGHGAALCRAAIALGLALGLEVVAEGVETQEQRQFLAQERCSTIQGFLLARPRPAGDAFALVRSLLDVPRLKGSGRGLAGSSRRRLSLG